MRGFFQTIIGTATIVALIGVFAAAPAHASGENEFFGTVVGAGLGGLVGNQFGHGAGRDAATVAGVFLGGALGNNIGASMDRADRAYASPGAYYYPSYAGPVYYETTYVPNYVAPPAPAPLPAYYDPPTAYYDTTVSDYCREFTQQVRIDGQMQETYGTACLQPDGSWRIVP